MGASQSRLAKAGGNVNAATQALAQEYASGAKGWSPAQRAAYENPATRDAWVTQTIGRSTKGKSHGVFKAIGGAISKLAPIAAFAIPGLGIPAAALLAGGGRTVGRGLAGKSFSLTDTLASGALGAAGNAALGGKGITALKGLAGGGSAATSVAGAAPAAGRSVLGKVGDWVTSDPLRAAQLGLGAVNTVQGAKASGQANRMRQAALARVATQPPREDLSALYADSGNPYSRPGTGTSKRAAVRALGY